MDADRKHTSALAYIGLGANLGAALSTMHAAIDALANNPNITLLHVSSFYASAPVDAPGPSYTNAVISLKTSLDALALLKLIQHIEEQHGRERLFRNAPRTLDLDLLWFDNQTINLPQLTVPHPRAHQRAFVLMPWADIASNDFVLKHAGIEKKLSVWREAITDQTCIKCST
jgi:2-amino-4-hydroxy-6-hydroxymethyldihydropteridine diphosphokinase